MEGFCEGEQGWDGGVVGLNFLRVGCFSEALWFGISGFCFFV